jgi:hypothetical protein
LDISFYSSFGANQGHFDLETFSEVGIGKLFRVKHEYSSRAFRSDLTSHEQRTIMSAAKPAVGAKPPTPSGGRPTSSAGAKGAKPAAGKGKAGEKNANGEASAAAGMLLRDEDKVSPRCRRLAAWSFSTVEGE